MLRYVYIFLAVFCLAAASRRQILTAGCRCFRILVTHQYNVDIGNEVCSKRILDVNIRCIETYYVSRVFRSLRTYGEGSVFRSKTPCWMRLEMANKVVVSDFPGFNYIQYDSKLILLLLTWLPQCASTKMHVLDSVLYMSANVPCIYDQWVFKPSNSHTVCTTA